MFPAPDDDPWTEIAERQQVRVPDLSRQPLLDCVQILTLVGSVLLVAGVYLPFHRGQSLWQIGLLDGVPLAGALILVLAQVSLALAMMRWHVGLWLTAFGVFMTTIGASFGRTPTTGGFIPRTRIIDAEAGWALLMLGAFALACAAAFAAWQDYRRAYPFFNPAWSPRARSPNPERSPSAHG